MFFLRKPYGIPEIQGISNHRISESQYFGLKIDIKTFLALLIIESLKGKHSKWDKRRKNVEFGG